MVLGSYDGYKHGFEDGFAKGQDSTAGKPKSSPASLATKDCKSQRVLGSLRYLRSGRREKSNIGLFLGC